MDLDWRALRVTGEVRSAIYDEQFPLVLRNATRLLSADLADAFDLERALAVLATFAALWDELDPTEPVGQSSSAYDVSLGPG